MADITTPAELENKARHKQRHPSKAFIDSKGKYHHDPLNQSLAEHEAQGKTGAQSNGQFEHFNKLHGYCQHSILGGCDRDND